MNAPESEALEILEGNVSDVLVQRTVRKLRDLIWLVRSGWRRKFPQRENGKRFPTNPLTFFGFASHVRFSEAFRHAPIRCTPAQMLGGHVAHMLVILHGEEQMGKLNEFLSRQLALWLLSDDCTQWLQLMEREIQEGSN